MDAGGVWGSAREGIPFPRDDGGRPLLHHVRRHEWQHRCDGDGGDEEAAIPHPDEGEEGRGSPHIALPGQREGKRHQDRGHTEEKELATPQGFVGQKEAQSRRYQDDEGQPQEAVAHLPRRPVDGLSLPHRSSLHDPPHPQHAPRHQEEKDEPPQVLVVLDDGDRQQEEEGDLHRLQEEEGPPVQLSGQIRLTHQRTPDRSRELHRQESEDRPVQGGPGNVCPTDGHPCEPRRGQGNHQEIFGADRKGEWELGEKHHRRDDGEERDPEIDERPQTEDQTGHHCWDHKAPAPDPEPHDEGEDEDGQDCDDAVYSQLISEAGLPNDAMPGEGAKTPCCVRMGPGVDSGQRDCA